LQIDDDGRYGTLFTVGGCQVCLSIVSLVQRDCNLNVIDLSSSG
jgi:hypothetical protein